MKRKKKKKEWRSADRLPLVDGVFNFHPNAMDGRTEGSVSEP